MRKKAPHTYCKYSTTTGPCRHKRRVIDHRNSGFHFPQIPCRVEFLTSNKVACLDSFFFLPLTTYSVRLFCAGQGLLELLVLWLETMGLKAPPILYLLVSSRLFFTYHW